MDEDSLENAMEQGLKNLNDCQVISDKVRGDLNEHNEKLKRANDNVSKINTKLSKSSGLLYMIKKNKNKQKLIYKVAICIAILIVILVLYLKFK